MNARRRLEDWFRRLETADGRMQREDVCFVMVQARHLIEMTEDRSQYRVVAFYADWTVHTALDRSPVCFEVLRDLSRVIAENMAPTGGDLTTQISRVIGFPLLREQLIALFRQNGLPTVVFEIHENWKNFVMFLTWCVGGQPVGFPSRPTGAALRIRDEIRTIAAKSRIEIEALAIVEHEGKVHWMLQDGGEKRIRILGAVELGEGREAFTETPTGR